MVNSDDIFDKDSQKRSVIASGPPSHPPLSSLLFESGVPAIKIWLRACESRTATDTSKTFRYISCKN